MGWHSLISSDRICFSELNYSERMGRIMFKNGNEHSGKYIFIYNSVLREWWNKNSYHLNALKVK